MEEIPTGAVQILEYGHGTVRLLAWRPNKANTNTNHAVVVSPEVIGLQEEEHPAAGLIADERLLLLGGGAGQEQRGTRSAGRRDDHPALVLLGLVLVLDYAKAELSNVEGKSFIVVTDYEGNVGNGLLHGFRAD